MLNILLNIIKIAFLLGFLIFIHEGGHFLVAKLCKIRVKEFAIGFGPIIWKKQGRETKYVLRAVPLGGFVNLLGEEQAVDEEGSFSKAGTFKKIAILVAGGLVNIIFGIVVYFVLTTTTGIFVSTEVYQIVENYAAESAGIQKGDKILEVNGKEIKRKSQIDKMLEKNNGEEINVVVERNNEKIELTLNPTLEENENSTRKYYLGIIFKVAEENFVNNIYYGFWDTVEFSMSIVDGVKELFIGNVGVDQLTGPVGISGVVAQTKNSTQFIYILALISISLGVTNLLPVPPLDGGKIVLVLIEGIIRKPINEKINVAIQMTGFFLIMGLAVLVTYNDVLRIF